MGNSPLNFTDPTGLCRFADPLASLPSATKPFSNISYTAPSAADVLLAGINNQVYSTPSASEVFAGPSLPSTYDYYNDLLRQGQSARDAQVLGKLAQINAAADLGSHINDPVIAALGNPYVQSSLTTLQGVGEASVATALALAPEPTGLTKIGAAAMGLKAIDTLQAGVRGLARGEAIPSVTRSTVQSAAERLGLPPGDASMIAGMVDVAPMVVGSVAAAGRTAGQTLATTADDVASGSSLSSAVQRGSLFNRLRQPKYEFKEVYVEGAGGRRYILDAYSPKAGEIVSLKATQFANVNVKTGVQYLQEAAKKYTPGTL